MDGELFIDVMDDYCAFKKNVARGIDGPYFGYVYGHIETNEEFDRDRKELSDRFVAALKRS